MENERLSEIEIKLINATRNFIKESNLHCSIGLTNWNEGRRGIEINNCLGDRLAGIYYADDFDNGEINIYGRPEENHPKRYEYRDKYQQFLIQEIPEIKNRIN